MNFLMVSALAASVAQPYGPATTDELVKSFDAICFRPDKPFDQIDSEAAAMGFRPAQVIPSKFNPETKAWRRGGVRLFETAGQREGWPVLPTCGVTGDVGRNWKTVVGAVSGHLDVFAFHAQPGPKESMYHLISARGIIDLDINKRDSAHVIVTLLWQVGQPGPTKLS